MQTNFISALTKVLFLLTFIVLVGILYLMCSIFYSKPDLIQVYTSIGLILINLLVILGIILKIIQQIRGIKYFSAFLNILYLLCHVFFISVSCWLFAINVIWLYPSRLALKYHWWIVLF